MEQARSAAVAAVTAFLQDAEVPFRAVADGEWGLVVDGCEIGLRLSGGLLRAQAWVAPPGRPDAHALLHANRLHPLARYAHSSGGDVWVQAEVPQAAAGDPAALDLLLGTLLEARARLR